MDPNAPQLPQPGLQPPSNNPYEFIMNPQKPTKRKGLSGSLALMLGLIVGGAVLLIVVLAVVVNILGSKPSVAEELVGVTQSQNELIRVANEGASSGIQQATRSLAVTTEYAMRTQQNATIRFLGQNGRTLGEKEVTLKQNARTDQQLALAKSTSTFDLVFSQVMQSHLTDYATDLKQIFTRTQNPDTRKMLSEYYEQTQLLISQVPYTQESIEAAQQ